MNSPSLSPGRQAYLLAVRRQKRQVRLWQAALLAGLLEYDPAAHCAGHGEDGHCGGHGEDAHCGGHGEGGSCSGHCGRH